MKVYVDDKGQPILPQYDSLTERLAQAERERDAAKADYREMRQAWDDATSERDEWKAKHANLASGSDGLVRQAAQYRDERDAALARAEAAEMRLNDGVSPHDYRLVRDQLAALRARIEALADVEEKDGYTGRAFDLRALLQPPKAETALDVLAEAERWVRYDNTELSNALAKLRKLLENERKDPP